mgnify:FL=1
MSFCYNGEVVKRLLSVIIFSSFSCISHAQYLSGTVESLLEKAETGDISALYSLAAGLSQIDVDSDDVMRKQINASRFHPAHMAQLDAATAALAVGMFYGRALPDKEFPEFYCKWTKRAISLYDKNPSLDPEAQMKWMNTKEGFPYVIESMSQLQMRECDSAASNWVLHK